MAVVNEPSRYRQTARLRELIVTNERIVEGLNQASRTWLTATVPELHAAGAAFAAQAVGSSFAWAAPHVEAVDVLAQRTWADIAPRLRDMSAETRRELRVLARDATRAGLLEDRTATQAGKDMAAVARDRGLFSVTYSNGARHTVADWADSVVRTTTAEAYNVGSVTQCRTDGIEYVEYMDGAGCSVGPGHNVGPEANGMIVALDDVVYLGHPRCRRSCAPAVDGRPSNHVNRDAGPARDPGPPPSAPPSAPRKPTRTPRTPRTPRAAPAALQPTAAPWMPQKSMAKLNEAFRVRHGVDTVGTRTIGFDGMTVDAANEMAATLDDLFTRFPKVASQIRVTGSSAQVTKAVAEATGRRVRGVGKGVLADARRNTSTVPGWLRVKASGGNANAWRVRVARLKADGYLAGDDGLRSIVTHEFGHHMDFLASTNGGAEYHTALRNAMAELPGPAPRFTAPDIAHENSDKIRAGLSRYGSTNAREMAAEAVSEALTSPAPRPMARKLLEVILRFSEEWTPA